MSGASFQSSVPAAHSFAHRCRNEKSGMRLTTPFFRSWLPIIILRLLLQLSFRGDWVGYTMRLSHVLHGPLLKDERHWLHWKRWERSVAGRTQDDTGGRVSCTRRSASDMIRIVSSFHTTNCDTRPPQNNHELVVADHRWLK